MYRDLPASVSQVLGLKICNSLRLPVSGFLKDLHLGILGSSTYGKTLMGKIVS